MEKKNIIIKNNDDIENDGTKLYPRERELPNDILHLIIYKLPFEFAVQTCCLSTQWKDAWQKSPLLAMVEDPSLENIDKTLTNFLEQLPEFNRQRQNWGFKSNFGRGRFLLVAITSNNKLVFDFSSADQEPETELSRPFHLPLTLNHQNPYDHLNSEVKKVKSLHLKSVSSLVCRAVSSLLSKNKLPFLQSLTIEKCQELQSLKINEAYGLSILNVLDCPKLVSIRLFQNYHKLKSFQYRGKSVLIQGVLPKDDLMLDFRQGLGYKYKSDKDSTFHLMGIRDAIKNCTTLTICGWAFQSIYQMLGNLYNYALKELWWIDSSMEEDNVDSLLICLLREYCFQLERLYVIIDPTCYKKENTSKLVAIDTGQKLRELELVKLEGFPNEEEEIKFVRRLIPLFHSAPKIIAKSRDGTCLRQLVKVDRPYEKNPYKFIQVLEHRASYYHTHMNFKL